MSALRQRRLRPRRGSALILVLLMTLAVAALAVAAIFMTSSAGLLSRFYDKERVAANAAESGLQMVIAQMRTASNFTVDDSDDLTTLLSGVPVLDADGQTIPGANVWVYAMRTGDVSAAGERTITLIARAYDSFGTRHVRRLDVRQESITKYALFFDTFNSGLTFGPTVLSGRVHSNGNLSNANQTRFMDSVTVVGTNSGGTFPTGLLQGADSVSFPRNDPFTALATQAAGDNLSITPTANRATRLEFVTLRLTAADTGAFVRFFELEAGLGDTLLRVNPFTTGSGGNTHHRFDHPIIQKQCGAFYFRGGRWQFFPVATHRASWAWNIINTSGFPTAPSGGNGTSAAGRETAARNILQLPTSRCFPAGSPYLMPTERLTNASGVISGTASQNTFPWGTGSSFPAANRYGGMDTTFTRRPRTCTIDNTSNGRCNNNTWIALGTWLNWPGGFTGAAQPADTIRITHWPIDVRRNAAFEGLVNVNGSTMVSGVVRGNVTLRVGGTASIIDHIVYESDPNDPSKAPCTDMLGLIATQDILVVDGAMTRLRRYGTSSSRYDLQLGGGPNFLLHGFLLSSGGTVGVQNPASTVQGTSGIECRAPPDATAGRRANGGCFVHVGGAAMRTYSEYSQGNGQNAGGIIPFPVADRCQTTGRQPPGFPSIASFRVLRSLTVDASRANTEPKILALLRSLRGANLD